MKANVNREPRRRPPIPAPARTSLAEILAAGRAIIEAEGPDGLTMQRVAAAVGVRAPSLYKRVRSRDDLLGRIVDEVADELGEALEAAARTGDPQRDLAAMADAVRAFARAQPAAYALLFAPLPEPERAGGSRLGAASGAVLRTAGALAGPAHALAAARLVVAWTHGFVSMELAGAFRLGGDVDEAFAFGVERLGAALRLRPEGRISTADPGR